MDYKEKLLKDIQALTYGEAMRELTRNMKAFHRGYDDIAYKDGKYYPYDHERKHSYKEAYGEEIKGEDLEKYLALKEVYEALWNGTIHAGVNKQINI